MLTFNDLTLVASIARLRSPRRAATAERIHVATVYRRLRDLESRLGQTLFEQDEGGYAPTPLALELAGLAEGMATALDEANRRAAGMDHRLDGTLRLTTTDTLLPLVLQSLTAFRAAHPAVMIDLAIGNDMADMARNEADIAIRPTRSPPETLIGRRLGAFDFALYRASSGAAGWIGFDDSLSGIPAAVWAGDHMDGPPSLRLNSLWGLCEAAIAGHGTALLPTYLTRGRPLERVGAPIDELRSEAWMLYHPDLKRTPRVHAFVSIMAPALASRVADDAASGAT